MTAAPGRSSQPSKLHGVADGGRVASLLRAKFCRPPRPRRTGPVTMRMRIPEEPGRSRLSVLNSTARYKESKMSALPSLLKFTDARLLRAAPTRRPSAAAEHKAEDRELSALMRAAQHGDRAAYTRLVREIMPLLQRVLRARLRSWKQPIGTTSCKRCYYPCIGG